MSTLATTALATATAVIGAAAMYLPAHLRLLDARAYRAAADDTFSQAERLAAEVERTRNLPWYWPTDPHVTGELVAVSMAAEQFDELAASIDVPDDAPALRALSDRSHADEQADHTDTDRPRWWATVVAFVVLAPVAFARRQLPVLVEWLAYRLKSQARRDAEFIESGQQALERARDEATTPALDPDGEALVELEAWVAANPPTNRTPYVGRHWLQDIEHTGQFPVVNASIPTQRTGDEA